MKRLLLVLSLLSPIQQLDRDVARAVQESRRPALERPMSSVTTIFKPVYVVGALVVLALVEGNAGAGTVRVALIAMAGTNLIVEGLKRITFRVRPDGEHKRSNASFPSGHSATAFALAWVLAKRFRRLGPAFLAIAAVIAFSRMYLNRHYLSDVTVGAAIGLLCAWATLRWLPLKAKHEAEETPPLSDLVR